MSTVPKAQPARYGNGLRYSVLAVSAGAGVIAVASGIAPERRSSCRCYRRSGANIAFGVLGESRLVRDELVRFGVVLSETTARDAAGQFELDHLPVGILQRDGVIIGSIHTDALISVEEIERFWTLGRARLAEAAA